MLANQRRYLMLEEFGGVDLGDTCFNPGYALDCGTLGHSIPVEKSKSYGARPVKNDYGALIAILFGPEGDLAGDVDDLARAVLQYQTKKKVPNGYTEEQLSSLYLGWVEAPTVIPIADGLSLPAERYAENFYGNIPDLSNVAGLFFASSAAINYMIDNKVVLNEDSAKRFGLYVPFSVCPAGA